MILRTYRSYYSTILLRYFDMLIVRWRYIDPGIILTPTFFRLKDQSSPDQVGYLTDGYIITYCNIYNYYWYYYIFFKSQQIILQSILNYQFFLANSADPLDPKELMPWIPANNVRSSSCVSNDTTTSALSNMRLPRDTTIEIPPHPDHNQQQRHSC